MDVDSIIFDLIWEVEFPQPKGLQLLEFVSKLFVHLNQNQIELSLLVTHDRRMQELNLAYRCKDHTTDVLSFPNECSPPPGEPRHLGDVALSFDQALRQAQEIGHSLEAEIRFLLLHGILHLLGFDHETDKGEMLALQSSLKVQLATYF